MDRAGLLQRSPALLRIRNDEDGAVTVDWVVLTAAIVALGLAVGTAVSNGATDLAGDVGTELTDM